jgi:peptide/nickel transport system substrate-binding protein/oligopeptide transport system substrate-binding protein
LDPILSKNYWESEIVLQIFDGLLRFDNQLNVAPALAQDWRVSPDGKTYIFNLRKGARFHNGREVVAQDAVYSFTRVLDPKWKSDDAPHFTRIVGATEFQMGRASEVAGLKPLDASTLQITLDRPYAPFLRVLAQQPASIVPREEVEKAVAGFGKNPVGTGPFRLAQWELPSQIVLLANPDYFGGKPFLNEIRITTLQALNAQECFQLFLDRKLDLSFVPPDQVSMAQTNPEWLFTSRPVLRLMYLGMNVRDRWLKRPEIRKAIVSAINKTELLGQAFDYSVTNGLLPFSLLGARPESYPDPYDPHRAIKALQLHNRLGKQHLTLQLWHAQVSESRNALLVRLANQLDAVGFRVELKIVSSMSELLRQVYNGKAQLFLLGEQIDFPDPDALLNRLFHSRSPGNPFGYANPKVDALLFEAQTTLDDNRRAQLYGEIENMILADSPILPLSLVKYSFAHHQRVRGLELTSLGFQYLPLKDVWMEAEK